MCLKVDVWCHRWVAEAQIIFSSLTECHVRLLSHWRPYERSSAQCTRGRLGGNCESICNMDECSDCVKTILFYLSTEQWSSTPGEKKNPSIHHLTRFVIHHLTRFVSSGVATGLLLLYTGYYGLRLNLVLVMFIFVLPDIWGKYQTAIS